MGTDYVRKDRGGIRELLQGWVPDPLPSPAWRGVADPNRRLNPDPSPTGRTGEPTMFLLWRIDYFVVDPTYDSSIDPYREGAIVFSAHTEPSAGDGRADALFAQLLEKLAEGDPSERLTLMPEAAQPVGSGMRGDWWVDGLKVPFAGG